ncbi:MAG: MerR family transcriptional regulator [Sphingomonas sp.]|jgi:DNA-binding transcriptional MerR regulator
MTLIFDIAEVARRTGLTSRALRFYEARGLVRPLRTQSGRRCYGAGELERLYQLTALKRAGLSLVQIKALFDKRPIDLRELLALKLGEIEEQARALSEMRGVLSSTLSRIDRGEPIDAATLCSLIRSGDMMMTAEAEKWKSVTDRYMSEEAKADFARKQAEMAEAFAGFDQASYSAKWRDLGGRIKAALPMDPASDAARAFAREWAELLKPFAQVATPAMWQGSQAMYSDMKSWEGQADPGFDSEVFALVQAAARVAKESGEDLGLGPRG